MSNKTLFSQISLQSKSNCESRSNLDTQKVRKICLHLSLKLEGNTVRYVNCKSKYVSIQSEIIPWLVIEYQLSRIPFVLS